MKNGLEVKNIVFGELRKISAEEYRDSSGTDVTWDGLVDGIDVKLILANSSEEAKKASIYIVSRPDMLIAGQWSWGNEVKVKSGGKDEIGYVVPMPAGVASSDYRDYTGPLRYIVEVRISDSAKGEVLLRKAKYYDIPAKVGADELEESGFDIYKVLKELEKTTILHDLYIDGNPKEGIKSIKAKLLNFGEKTQYIGIDIRAERKGSGWQTQFFYEVEPKKEVPIDIGGVVASIPEEEDLRVKGRGTVVIRHGGIEYLRIRAVSIPEHVFKSQRARSWFLGESYEYEEEYKSSIAKFDFYFKEGE